MGRKLENYFIFYPLKILSKKIKFDKFLIEFVNGPKNKPAKNYFGDLQKKTFKKKLIKKKFEIPFSKIKEIPIRNKHIYLYFKN